MLDKHVKKFKDPIYGYIEIPIEYTTNIIDKAEFQRLRRIIQTSYSPLYSSAIHNRFVHSLGVFYLGKKASDKVHIEISNLIKDEKIKLQHSEAERLKDIYLLACLLHDVGHAPFSHTGEQFYKGTATDSKELVAELINITGNNNEFAIDTSSKAKGAAPHEIMSAIVGIKSFPEFFLNDEEKEFFARCITGYKYEIKKDELKQIKNCYISLLNSQEIDVDRLDYLIRDAYTSGYNSVNIDYERLLDALTVVKENGIYRIAYKKNAISVLENVLYAHDAEKKWIQTHPSILYEMHIITHIIKVLNDKLNIADEDTSKYIKSLFSVEALSQGGVELNNNIRISLLCDDDLIYLAKTFCTDDLSKEYFNRDKRRHPIWKSEAEYKAWFTTDVYKKEAESLMNCLQSFASDVRTEEIVINRTYEEKLKKEKESAEKQWKAIKDDDSKNLTTKKSLKASLDGTKKKYELCKFLNTYANTHGFIGDYVVIAAKVFDSSFSEDGIKNTLTVFEVPQENPIVRPLGDVCSILNATKQEGQFYYIFYRREGGKKVEFNKDFFEALFATQL